MTYCAFHPLQAAHNYCPTCQKKFCLECSNELDESEQNYHGYAYYCFICNSELESLREESSTPPFWRNLDKIYRYPSSAAAISVIVVTALLSAFISFSIFAIIPAVLMMHYSFVCLRVSARGEMDAPDFENCFEGSIGSFFSFLIIFIIGLVFISLVTALLGNGFGVVAGVLCLLALPASIITLCIEESFLPALNPSKLWLTITTMGASYFFAFLFIFIMTSSVAAIGYVVGDSGTFVNAFILGVVSNYYSVVIFHILGYLVFQNAEKLDFQVKKTESDKQVRNTQKRLNANIEVLIKAGAYQKAIALCAQQIKTGDATLSQWKRCMKLLLADGDDKNVEGFAERYFDKLQANELYDSMADDYVAIKKQAKNFEPKNIEQKLLIARALIDVGRYKYVVLLLRDFAKLTKEKKQVLESLTLLSEAHSKIPGQEEKAKRYQQQYSTLSAIA